MHFENFHLKPDNSLFLSQTGSLHALMAQYAKLIFNNWSYYSGLSTTKVKKPYLEQLIFRGLEYGLVPILRSVGVFPKLVDINIIPKLEFFNDSYNKNQNKNKEIKGMVKWIGEELIKLAPTSTLIEDKKDSKPKAPKLVPRDVNELLLTSLVQEGQKNKSLLLPHVVACMIRFVQTYDMRIESPVFSVGYLVDNGSLPTSEWQEHNPSAYPKTPRHMRCVQEEFDEDEPKKFINFFSDLLFEQPSSEDLPVALNLMTLVVFENNSDPMFSYFGEVCRAAKQYRTEDRVEKRPLVHIGQIGTTKTRLSPAKAPKSKSGSKAKGALTHGDSATPTKPSPKPSQRIPRKKDRTTKKKVHDDEMEWVKFVKKETWNDMHLSPPPAVWEDDINNTEARFLFLDRILTFNKRMELAKWLATKPPERLSVLDNATEQNLTKIRTCLEKVTWDHDIEQIKEEYNKELLRQQEEKEKEEKRKADEREKEARDKKKRERKVAKEKAKILARAKKKCDEIEKKESAKYNSTYITPFQKILFYICTHVLNLNFFSFGYPDIQWNFML